jgi:hypothetical protein
MKKTSIIAALMLTLSVPVSGLAQSTVSPIVAPGSGTEEVNILIVYGEDDCPKGQGDEIIVCARHPESERYRIPKRLREKSASPGAPGWTNQVAGIEEVQREMLPTSGCSVISSSGAGCLAKALRQWLAERRMMKSESQP